MVVEFVYSHIFDEGEYSSDPAADKARFDRITEYFNAHPDFIEASPAPEADILLAHSESHVEHVKRDGYLFNMACLAAGGAIQVANLAMNHSPAFGVIRPPGHHASERSAWGFCFFNNISVSLLKLVTTNRIASAFILDFDLHTGDGNINILGKKPGITILNPDGGSPEQYIENVKATFEQAPHHDILACSAGFDQYINDWGGLLRTQDFTTIGRLAAKFSEEKCNGRRYALLEGGYNYPDLMKNILAFCDGFSGN
nr:histone deacetylase family protein [Candidatus Sigynarchaeota archaeon]